MRQVTSRSKLIRTTQIALVAATILAPSIAMAQWQQPYSGYDPYGYTNYGGLTGYSAYGYYGGPATRYNTPSDQIHWYTRNPPDFNS